MRVVQYTFTLGTLLFLHWINCYNSKLQKFVIAFILNATFSSCTCFLCIIDHIHLINYYQVRLFTFIFQISLSSSIWQNGCHCCQLSASYYSDLQTAAKCQNVPRVSARSVNKCSAIFTETPWNPRKRTSTVVSSRYTVCEHKWIKNCFYHRVCMCVTLETGRRLTPTKQTGYCLSVFNDCGCVINW